MGFEPTISAGERLQTYALDRADTVTGFMRICDTKRKMMWRRTDFEN